MVTIGVPRALFYYYYFPLWKTFFEALGAQVVVSPPTNKSIVNQGVSLAVDEACLPVKTYYGHVAALQGRVDYLFVPRLASVEAKAYICPKLMGLPDMLRAGVPGLPPLIDVTVDLSREPGKITQTVHQVGRYLTGNRRAIDQAWLAGCEEYRRFREQIRQGNLPVEVLEQCDRGSFPVDCREKSLTGSREKANSPLIALLGHGYNLYDRHISLDIIPKLRRLGARVLTADLLPGRVVEEEASRLPKRMFWTMGKRIIGGAYHYLGRADLRGMVHVAAFGCGPDSLVGDLVERIVRRDGQVPFLSLTVDEHTGEAGLNTRLEAFMDMIAWRGAV